MNYLDMVNKVLKRLREREVGSVSESAYSRLYYVENFDKWLKDIDPTVTSVPKDKRLIIPIFNAKGGLIGVQGRTLEDHHLRYITIKLDKDVERLWYGLEQDFSEETIYVVEGPLDSLFLPNCVAMVGINDTGPIPKAIRGKRIILQSTMNLVTKQLLSVWKN